ncbi:MAG: hypothetical protein Q4C45_00870 [Oscillospiraceae bacterium]|nr:hypothetical protein [Oscillospiraceae bacterium]
MKELFLRRLANLLTVKSLVTIALTVTFCVLTVKNALPQDFMTIYSMIITFYFAVQASKEGGSGAGV